MSNIIPQSASDESLSLINSEENHIEAHDQFHGPNIYNCFIIECCTGGFASIIINDREFPIKEGDCYGLLPGNRVVHRTTKESARSELSCFNAFLQECVDAIASQKPLRRLWLRLIFAAY